jgi:hypothetical protein
MSTNVLRLPPSATCPGCGAIVMLPSEPLFEDTPPAICAECQTEVPDYRRSNYNPEVHKPREIVELPPAPRHYFTPAPAPTPTEVPAPVALKPQPPPTPLEQRIVSRGNLFRSLGGLLAERVPGAGESDEDKGGS